jgi:hypothetical protein
MDAKYEGLFPPGYCPRGLTDCESLSQIIAEGHASFICCGENDGSTRVQQDRYRICIKSGAGIDSTQNGDKRDLMHQASVVMGALAVIEQEDCVAYHRETG